MKFFKSKKQIIYDQIEGQKILDYSEITKFLGNYKKNKGLSYEGLRLDMIENNFKVNNEVFFVNKFPLNLISKRRQGWTPEGVLSLINSLLKHFGIMGIDSLENFNLNLFSKDLFQEIKDHIPPIIISILPDGTINLEDGNHRLELAENIFKLNSINAFVLK